MAAPPPPQGYLPPQPGYPQPGYPQPGYPQPGAVAYPPPPPGPQPQQQQVEAPRAPAGCSPGLEYLTQVDQLLVNQQVEMLEVLTGFETQNKYKICTALGQQVYFAAEGSNCCVRQFCPANCRPFAMQILDNNQREVIHLERPFRCCAWCCCCFCCLQTIKVQSPPGTIIGYVDQVHCTQYTM